MRMNSRPTRSCFVELITQGKHRIHSYWDNWYSNGGWLLWFGILFLFFSSCGNWGYTYRAHQKYGRVSGKSALGILDERYARGDISREDYGQMKMEIARH